MDSTSRHAVPGDSNAHANTVVLPYGRTMSGELITTAQAAEMLGVQPATIYSYVARGVLTRATATSRHEGSLFRRSDVVALRDTRLRKRSGIFELGMETGITRIDPDGLLFYRGHDATDLARSATYEQVAELLWQTGELDWTRTPASRHAAATALAAAPDAGPAARARLAVAVLAAQPMSGSRSHVAEAGVCAINAAADALHPDVGSIDAPPARRVAVALAGHDDAPMTVAVQGAMVLLADHELATSAVAARVAASTGSKVLDVLTAGLSAMPGPRHAQVSLDAADLLRHARANGIREAIDHWEGRLPGFGHIVYAAPDPRYTCMLQMLSAVDARAVHDAEAVALEVLRRTGHHPNVDLALATMEVGVPLATGAGEAIFTVARTAGLVAHHLEEQGKPLRFRPRGDYTGPG